eukprot:TRINITY_DN54106_c0_g1_i1.p1 TRINITY_DN54106_c0_g1~~TRINITY_DN54106_c0_g1_i1.p1  ORF type:complete len:108 (+),score=27.56 TRINITY_DN54106_c0_g1_i1:115-438(+)
MCIRDRYARAHGDPTSEHYHQYKEIDLDEASNMMLFFGLTQCGGSILLGFISTKLNYYLMNLICAVGSAAVLAAIPLSLIHISEPTRLLSISYAVFCLKKKTRKQQT